MTTPSTRTLWPATGVLAPLPCTVGDLVGRRDVAARRRGGGGSKPLLRGFGAPAAKSAALLSVSVAPSSARRAAVVFDRPGAGAAPSKLLAVVP